MPTKEIPTPEEPIGWRLKGARYESGLSQEGVADALSGLWGRRVRQGVYSQWERGENKPDEDTVRALVAVFAAAGVTLTPGWVSHGSLSGAPVPKWWAAQRERIAEEEAAKADLEPALPPTRKTAHPVKGKRRRAS